MGLGWGFFGRAISTFQFRRKESLAQFIILHYTMLLLCEKSWNSEGRVKMMEQLRIGGGGERHLLIIFILLLLPALSVFAETINVDSGCTLGPSGY